MLNYIWLGLLVFAVVIGGVTGHMKEVSDGAFNMAKTAVMDISLPLIGIMALWLGIMRLAEKSGMVQILARLLRPLMVRLFPDVPPEHPAMGSMVMNMAANMLGLSNAATPLGIRAMKDLDSLNPRPGTATNAMCTFLAINTSSIQLIPVTAVAILAVNKSKDPSSIIGSSFLATVCAAISAIIMVKILEKLPMFRLPPITEEDRKKKAEQVATEATKEEAITIQPLQWWGILVLVGYALFFLWLFVSLWFPEVFGKPVPEDLQKDNHLISAVKTLSLLSIPILLSFFPLYAFVRRIKVYEEFVEGAKEGFQVIIKIIPNLVAILVAIGMFRGAGGIDMLTKLLAPAMNLVRFPPELLPMALVRPLSGSGTLGIFTDLVTQNGADHILSRMAGTIYGSTETTFYVLAVYFGATGIKRSRHAVPAGLVADTVSIIASVIICRLMFK
ncbi:nucleoside recognition domain-containing protein [Pedosphaera parvula]|uniref:Nucleoside recognition domain protein n=1 Tax=Pedosphaera parvula (strain Ellin514) TaxID=320771 RepID=B9XEM7_PEDPL|nr:spore maturation protein [Pedosphaera parvula]EEF61741.1 nucleoside recognition domain protein [Pedosphaera parvula Ellin514]